jgi:hypothetical protein
MHGFMATSTFPRYVRSHRVAHGAALIHWTSRAELNREFTVEQLRHEEYVSPAMSVAAVVRVLQAELRTRRRNGICVTPHSDAGGRWWGW